MCYEGKWRKVKCRQSLESNPESHWDPGLSYQCSIMTNGPPPTTPPPRLFKPLTLAGYEAIWSYEIRIEKEYSHYMQVLKHDTLLQQRTMATEVHSPATCLHSCTHVVCLNKSCQRLLASMTDCQWFACFIPRRSAPNVYSLSDYLLECVYSVKTDHLLECVYSVKTDHLLECVYSVQINCCVVEKHRNIL